MRATAEAAAVDGSDVVDQGLVAPHEIAIWCMRVSRTHSPNLALHPQLAWRCARSDLLGSSFASSADAPVGYRASRAAPPAVAYL